MKKTQKIIGFISCFLIVLIVVGLFHHEVEAEELKKQVVGTFYIDTQYQCKTFEGTSILVSGWIMTNASDSTMKIYIDGKDTNTDLSKRVARPDVLSAISGYGGEECNPKPGFEGTLDIRAYAKGKHTVTYSLEQSDGTKIYSESYQVNFDNETKGMIDIDSPNIYAGTATTKEANLKVNGWIMTNDTTSQLNIYIDGTKMKTTLTRTARPDVLSAISGYGGKTLNPKPGFETTIDLSQISQGTHQMTYQLETTDGKVLAQKSANIQIKKGEFYIDTQYNCTKFEGRSIFIGGWIMTSDPSSQMKLYIDGQDTKTDFSTRIARTDVLSAIKGYGGATTNPKPGFEGILDISQYSNGEHILTYSLEQADGTKIYSENYKVIFENKLKGTFDIDTPNPYRSDVKIKQDKITVNGWIMSTDSKATLSVLIDGKDTNATIGKRTTREDVLMAISGYDKNINALPGFNMEIDLSSYSGGEHHITYQLKASTGEILMEKKAKINIQRAEFYVENPTSSLWETKNITIGGWLMASDKTATIKVLINGNEVNIEDMKRKERSDVIEAIKAYGGKENNPTPGFEGKINISSYGKGQYDLTYRIQTESGEILAEETKKITIDDTPKAMVDIDSPDWRGVENVDGQITGWVMTNIQNPKIRVFIDQYERWDAQHRVERPDVLQAISGYGGKENNPTPGFVIDMKYGDFAIGNHTLKIIIEDETGKQVTVKTRNFTIAKAYTLEEGSFGFSGLKVKGEWKGTDLKYYKIGDGPNVFFATFAVHGFEDQWNHDGAELTTIAETFKNRLVNDKDRSILSKWTIYIFPQVNPDGVNYGWSNNGPGRRTLYSWAPGNEGIDMNRCWQSGGYTQYTGRNYNGTGPFQAYEAGYLKDFLLKHKATNGQTVLIDLHGWTTQLIGDYGICHECYAPYFPNNSYTESYGTGYLVNWARSSLGANGRAARSALIELPSAGINSHQDVVNAGYADRYINATLYMLRVLE